MSSTPAPDLSFELRVRELAEEPGRVDLSSASRSDRGAEVGLVILILARDEAEVLRGTLVDLNRHLGPLDEVHVVADHCRDATARAARGLGARVWTRSGPGPSGKGAALHWWLQQTADDVREDRAILILDADSRLGPGFFEALRARVACGFDALQARVAPAAGARSFVARLAGYSEIVDQRVSDRLRTRLGLPVRLRGTGMVIRRRVLQSVSGHLRSAAEDAELTLLLSAKGFTIAAVEEASVIDVKPEEAAAAARQRARWLKGQLEIVAGHPGPIARLLLQGLPGWSILSSILLKPRGLLVPAKVAAAAAFIAYAGPFGQGAGALLLASVCYDLAVLAVGLAFVPDRGEALRSLILSPAYTAVWVRSLVLAASSRSDWLRSRPVGSLPSSAAEADGSADGS